jgi:hypothetical protein
MSRPLRSLRLSPKSDYARFTGDRGEIFYDPVNNTLRVFNSQTQGGEIIATRTWVAGQLPNLATQTYVNQAIAAIPGAAEYLLKVTADDSTVLAVDRDETLQVRGQGMVNTSISTDSTGVQLVITAPDVSDTEIDINAQFGSPTVIPTERVVKAYADLLFNLQTAQLQDGSLDTTLNSVQFNSGVAVAEFSNDLTFTDNSPFAAPTEAAVRGYIDRRLGLTHNGDAVSQIDKIGPRYLTASEFFVLLQTSSSAIGADDDRTIDADQHSLSAWTASFTATRTLSVSNLIQGRMVTVYVRNTNGSSRTINIQASATATGFAPVNMSRGAGQTSVTSITLAATTGTAVITLFGANGEICGMIN